MILRLCSHLLHEHCCLGTDTSSVAFNSLYIGCLYRLEPEYKVVTLYLDTRGSVPDFWCDYVENDCVRYSVFVA